MGKRVILVCLALSMLVMSACGGEKESTKKIGDIPFEILSEDCLPEEVWNLVQERKKYEFMTSYSDGNDLYIIVGYGKQQTGGYSIRIDEFYETGSNIKVGTTFLGPEKDKKVSQEESYPYIVIKTKDIGKTVVFD